MASVIILAGSILWGVLAVTVDRRIIRAIFACFVGATIAQFAADSIPAYLLFPVTLTAISLCLIMTLGVIARDYNDQ